MDELTDELVDVLRQQAMNYYNEALTLEAQSAVLSARYHDFEGPF